MHRSKRKFAYSQTKTIQHIITKKNYEIAEFHGARLTNKTNKLTTNNAASAEHTKRHTTEKIEIDNRQSNQLSKSEQTSGLSSPRTCDIIISAGSGHTTSVIEYTRIYNSYAIMITSGVCRSENARLSGLI